MGSESGRDVGVGCAAHPHARTERRGYWDARAFSTFKELYKHIGELLTGENPRKHSSCHHTEFRASAPPPPAGATACGATGAAEGAATAAARPPAVLRFYSRHGVRDVIPGVLPMSQVPSPHGKWEVPALKA